MPRRYPKSRIDAALALLDEAAKEKKEELQKHVGSGYANIRGIFENGKEGPIAHARHTLEEKVHDTEERLHKAMESSNKILKESAETLEKNMHEHPVTYLGGIAAFSLAVGYLLGKKRESL